MIGISYRATAAILLSAGASYGQIHVDPDAPGPSRDGTSWTTAYATIQAGIDAAAGAGGGEVWVADGTYMESIVLSDGVELYGGFSGSGGLEETALSERNPALNVTTIDASQAALGDPAKHVVVMDGIASARLDGFTITGGVADQLEIDISENDISGGGILCSGVGGGMVQNRAEEDRLRQRAFQEMMQRRQLGMQQQQLGMQQQRLSISQAQEARNVQAFQTPLATLHAFQGWADKFLTTPAGGIEDFYVSVARKFRGTSYSVVYHRFDPETGGPSYGSEWDLVVKRPFAERYSVDLKYANYNASSHATDTEKLWVMFIARFGN
ncbi:MAG: hypothetical protein IIB77_02255 [Proteobacteria bacterium]|nr:hypothetical protein [Pseudomonadota bacterium]